MSGGLSGERAELKTVLVTGTTGFIGQHLCSVLLKRGVELHILGRRQPEIDAKFHYWDLIEPLNATSLAGIDTIFHLAGKAHALAETRQDEDEYFQINTESTRKLLEEAKKSGVQTFVYFSSVKAVGDMDGVMDESVSVEADTPYGRSKRASERLVLEGRYVPCPIVIRPSMVYGNTEKGNLPKMIRAIYAGKFPPLPEMNNRRSMVHVNDVVQAALLAAGHAESAGKTYIVTDGENYSTRQMYEWICEALHKPVPIWYLPLFVLKLMAVTGNTIGALSGRRFVFDSDTLDKLTGSALYSSEKICDELGFNPKYNLRDSLPEIVRFLGLNKS